MIHELKTDPKHFQNVKHGSKKFEIRKNDRNFKLADTLILREFQKGPDGGYSLEMVIAKVTHILYDYEFPGIKEGYCIMSIEIIG